MSRLRHAVVEPRIVACVCVKDEAELIEATLAHLRVIGVELVVACDMFSTDGTAEILREHESDDTLWLVQMSDRESQETWSREMLGVLRQTGAEWVIFLDGDELPVPLSGDLRTCTALHGADVVRIPRYNVVLTPAGPALPAPLEPARHDELLLIEARPDFWSALRDDPRSAETAKPIKPKAMARLERIDAVTVGAHDVVTRGPLPVRRVHATDVVTAHLAVTTRTRFVRKAANIRALLAAHPDLYGGGAGEHWRYWEGLTDAELGNEVGRMTFDAEAVTALRGHGVIRSAAEILGSAR